MVQKRPKDEGNPQEKKKYNGLKFLDRGASKFQSKKGHLEAKKLRKEAKKKDKLQKLLVHQAQVIPKAVPDSESEDDSFELSDEDVGSGDIVFKDAAVQREWSPDADDNKAKKNKSKEAAKSGKSAKPDSKRKEPGPVSAAFQVPGWGSDEDEADEEAPAKPAKAAKKAPLKGQTDALNSLAKKAGFQKAQVQAEREKEEEERRKAQQAKKAYFKKRKEDRAKHMKKTSKGQPVMKHMISGILDKLQKE